jgi:hypothetical protein
MELPNCTNPLVNLAWIILFVLIAWLIGYLMAKQKYKTKL